MAVKLALYIIILLVSILNQFQINVIAISECFSILLLLVKYGIKLAT